MRFVTSICWFADDYTVNWKLSLFQSFVLMPELLVNTEEEMRIATFSPGYGGPGSKIQFPSFKIQAS